MIVKLSHPETGVIRGIKVGWSWTVFLFGAFALLFRSQFVHAFIYFLIAIFTFGIGWIIAAVVYGAIANKLLAHKLMMENGLVFDSDNNVQAVRVASMKWGVKVPDKFSIASTEK